MSARIKMWISVAIIVASVLAAFQLVFPLQFIQNPTVWDIAKPILAIVATFVGVICFIIFRAQKYREDNFGKSDTEVNIIARAQREAWKKGKS